MQEKLLCLDAAPQFLNAFDFSVAPQLLFYAYIPIIAVLILMSVFIVRGSGFSLKSKLFLALGMSFVAWVLSVLVQWTAVEADIVYFAWQITPLIEIFIPLSALYLAYVLIDDRDAQFGVKLLFALIVLIVCVLTPTSINMSTFNVISCEPIVGPLTYYVYIFEIIAVLWIVILGFQRYHSLKSKDSEESVLKIKQLPLIIGSSSIFLFVFALSNIAGELTGVYSINLFGPIGMVVFLGVLAYLIVKYQAFNIKLLATEALVWTLLTLIGAQFFFIQVFTNYVLTAITFLTTFILGNYLIGSVKREVSQREQLQVLLKERESLEHLISHKVKGSFTRSKFVFAEMLAGSFGEMGDKMREMAQGGLDANNSGIKTVDLILNSFNLQSGTVTFDMKEIDFKSIVAQVANEKRGPAERKGLVFDVSLDDGAFKLIGDEIWLKEAVSNLVENSVRYTPQGSIKLFLKNIAGKAVFSIQDTGVGITPEDKANLFKQGGRGKDSVKINTDSTGYGLYSVKLILDAHKGEVLVESPGKDQGSTFYIKLDLVK